MRTTIHFGLALILILGRTPLGAQEAVRSGKQSPGGMIRLKIVPLDGQDVTNATGAPGAMPVVEVRDDAERPVPGAKVVFELPESGPGGSFTGESKIFETKTNRSGQATTTPWTANSETGPFHFKVTAVAGDRTAVGLVPQKNGAEAALPKAKGMNPKWKWVGLIAGGAAAAVVVAIMAGGTSSSAAGAAAPPPPSITPGTVTIGGPK